MTKPRYRILLALGTAVFAAQAQGPGAPAPHGYSRVEWAQIQGAPPIEIRAQLDGSGEYTVLNAEDIKYASTETGMNVHFTVDDGEVMPGHQISLALPIIKDQHLRDRNGGTEHRPVVTMSFCIGDRAFTTTVTLMTRTSYTPQLVLSKADAAQFAPLDSQIQPAHHPACGRPTPAQQPAAEPKPAP
ncbi:MAG: RimK/LysX family protein [Nevskia sp.]|nr:RimK/LysX family protein [Nevskia sp.]